MTHLKSELFLAALLLCFGVAILPFAVYLVGQFVVGPYAGDGGVGGLFESIWAGLGQGHISAWIFVLSPYITVQLVRASRTLWVRSRAL